MNAEDVFQVSIADQDLAELRSRPRSTRWPASAPGEAWRQGVDLDYLQRLCGYWADEFDWTAQVRWLNTFDHYRVNVDGVAIHFVYCPARGGHGVPLILTHGWPSAFVEYLPVASLLNDPEGHGIDGPAFDVVIPSLPGYAYSERPEREGLNYREVARLWHRLMNTPGFERYVCGGTDFGSGVATMMAMDHPSAVYGLHLSNLELQPSTGVGVRPLSAVERSYVARSEAWWRSEGGYKEIQATRPQTIGYALNDSPAGLGAWIVEKWRAWGDTHGDVDARFSRDFLLTIVTLYWLTETATTAARDYFDNRWHPVRLTAGDRVGVPTAVAVFDDPAGVPPREWADRLYNVTRWTPMPRGGHFAAVEDPELLARDIATFVAGL